jgi:hypothetical protein
MCGDQCSQPEKVIYLEEMTVTSASGKILALNQRNIDAGLCIGCGICSDGGNERG